MDFVNKITSSMNNNNNNNNNHSENQGNMGQNPNQNMAPNQGGQMQNQAQNQGGGGGFLSNFGGLGDKLNSAAGGGKESEKNEDYLDKGTLPYPIPFPCHPFFLPGEKIRIQRSQDFELTSGLLLQESTCSKKRSSSRALKTTSQL